jgi:hypothetical protein
MDSFRITGCPKKSAALFAMKQEVFIGDEWHM